MMKKVVRADNNNYYIMEGDRFYGPFCSVAEANLSKRNLLGLSVESPRGYRFITTI